MAMNSLFPLQDRRLAVRVRRYRQHDRFLVSLRTLMIGLSLIRKCLSRILLDCFYAGRWLRRGADDSDCSGNRPPQVNRLLREAVGNDVLHKQWVK